MLAVLVLFFFFGASPAYGCNGCCRLVGHADQIDSANPSGFHDVQQVTTSGKTEVVPKPSLSRLLPLLSSPRRSLFPVISCMNDIDPATVNPLIPEAQQILMNE